MNFTLDGSFQVTHTLCPDGLVNIDVRNLVLLQLLTEDFSEVPLLLSVLDHPKSIIGMCCKRAEYQ